MPLRGELTREFERLVDLAVKEGVSGLGPRLKAIDKERATLTAEGPRAIESIAINQRQPTHSKPRTRAA